MIETNVFMYENNFFKQISGLPMGCICGPSVENIYVRFIDDTQTKFQLILRNFL